MSSIPAYTAVPSGYVRVGAIEVACFHAAGASHRHERTIASFGQEWERFHRFDEEELQRIGAEYFDIVPPELYGPHVVALDLGCGSGRWTRWLAPRVGRVEAIDPSEAVLHAARVHADLPQVRWTRAGVDEIPFAEGTFDLIVCLGVLHHVPDTAGALRKAVRHLKPGGHLLLYLYYALDGRGPLYRLLHRLSEVMRRAISAMPGAVKRLVCDLIAFAVYLPLRTLARGARAMDPAGRWWHRLPLSYYHDKSLTILRNDALDRFGTPLEQRFTRAEMRAMMEAAGLTDIVFSGRAPYWHALGRRR
jgi:SAM-dependent methyltransferase